jgi:hypothetical protein
VYVAGSAAVDYSLDNLGRFNNKLFREFLKYGLIISTLEECELFISINHSSRLYKKFKKLGKKRDQAVLIRYEPSSVFPAQYTERITDKYGLVITLGHREKECGNFYFLPTPYSYLPNPNLPMNRGLSVQSILKGKEFNTQFNLYNWEKRKFNICLIASNKVAFTGNNNYNIRRSLAYTLSKDNLRIYGELWDSNFYHKFRHRLGVTRHGLQNMTIPNIMSIYGSFFRKYDNYIGPIEDKHVIVKQSKFSLIIENSNNYVSEKIFDAMINGSIPLYYGPKLEEYGIPGKDIAITCEGSAKILEDKIKLLSLNEVKNYLSSIQKYLVSKDFKNEWLENVVYQKISKKIFEFHLFRKFP